MRALLLALSLIAAPAAVALADQPAAPAAPAAPAPAGVKVLDAGKGAKAQLRYALKIGAKQTMTMTMAMGMQITVGQNAMPAQTLPPVTSVIELSVVERTPAGYYRIDYRYGKIAVARGAKVDPSVKTAMEASLAELADLKGSILVSELGQTVESKTEIPAKASPQTRQLIGNFERAFREISLQVPFEAVGVGARWKASAPIDLNGMKVEQSTTVELLERKGTRLRLKIEVAQSAAPQTVDMNGVRMELVSLRASGGGELSLDTKKVAPKKSRVDMTSSMEAKAMGQAMTIGFTLGVDVQSK